MAPDGEAKASQGERRRTIMGRMARRLPAPWTAEKMPGGYVVRDANGQALAYVLQPGNRADAMQGQGVDRG
jgi:hypothetical protein